MSLLDLIIGNGKKEKKEELAPVLERLDDIEEILHSICIKTDDKFDAVFKGIDAIMPHEKGQFINKVEEKLAKVKREMVYEAILAECVRDAKSYSELRRAVRERTGLNVSGSFLDSCIKRLAYEGRLERIGNRFICAGSVQNVQPKVQLLDKKEESELISELLDEDAPTSPSNGGNGNKLDWSEMVLNIVRELEGNNGGVPVESVLTESEKRGIAREEALQLIDEHLMVTGRLYEPKQGCIKTVKPSITA
jgi:hypothetical protein